ncbi:hypothetical protein ILUMI_08341 [Ignelater luminosus]|uniref:Partner of Y14 and mago n=1 Tax=Ignelater luminosus TaxID=2038154 RepID=A0A8K0D1T9_IGNLU|nr:hypothetical protein ILUMI_08341 [Ignelater luminosus]
MYASNVRDENGDSFIPASQRPDGTWRKARRVKEGYVPQEEVPLYESKGKQFANRVTKPVTALPSGHVAHQSIPGLFILDDKEKSKNKKKTKNVEEISKNLEQVKLNESSNAKVQSKTNKSDAKVKTETKTAKTETKVQKSSATEANNQTTDPAKRLKNLKKRLREVEALEEKLKNGQIAKPEPDQLTKIQRKNDLLMQIRELEKLV